MSRALRWLLGTLGVLTAIAVAAVIGLRIYLTSSAVAGQAAEQLSAQLNTPVRVRAADLGMAGPSTLKGVQLFAPEDDKPWAEIDEAEANVSALDLAGGAAPTRLTLRGAAVELHFATDGTLLTRLPTLGGTAETATPSIRLENSRLTLRQDGREPMTVSGINATVEPIENGIELKGNISDGEWGEWTAEGGRNAAGQMTLHLTTPQTHLTQAQLRSVPFVPPEVWKEVQAEGEAAVDLTLRFDGEGKYAHYRIALDVVRAAVGVSALALRSDKTTGSVVIEDGFVKLHEMAGRVADGRLAIADAELDFRKVPFRMTFAFTGRDLNPRQLPETWKEDGRLGELLKGFNGELRLHGNANLTVTVDHDGKVQTSGEGEAELTGVMLAGKEAKITLKLDLGNRVRFSSLPRALPLLMTALHADVSEPKKDNSHVELNLELKDVDLAQLIKELRLELPLQVAGRLSFKVKAGVPLDTPRDLKTYRVEGTATLPTLKLAGVALEAVEAKFHYANGILHLDKLAGGVPAPDTTAGRASAGRFAGEAQWGLLVDDGKLTANLKVDSLPVAALRPLLPETKETVTGSVSGNVKADVAANKLNDLAAWNVTGSVGSNEVRLYGRVLRKVTTDLKLDEGVARLTKLHGDLDGAPLSGVAKVPLKPAKVGSATLEFTDLDAGAVARSVPDLPLKIEGKATGKLQLELPPLGADKPADVGADLTLTEGRLRIQNIPTRKLQGTVRYRDGATEYELQGETLGGKFQLDGKLPARDKAPEKREESRGRLRVERAQLSQLWSAFNLPALGPLTGRFDIDVPFTVGPDGRPAGRGRFLLSGVRLSDGSLAEELRGDVFLADDALDFRDVSGRVAGGLARVRVRYNLRQPDRSFFTVMLERVESSVLLRSLQGTADYVRGPANVQLRGRLGNQWSGRGEVVLLNGHVLGAAVSEWRLPVDIAFTPVQGRGEIVISDSHAEVGRGRVNARATLRWGGTTRLDGTLRFNRVEVRELLSHDTSLFGSGRASGRFDFRSDDLRSVNDLAGTLEATLDETQPMRLPVLRELGRYVLPGQGGARFEDGDVRGRLGNGVFRLQRLALANAYAQLFLEGTITLAGRLNLESTARTGNLGVGSLPARLLGLRLPALGPIPLGIITELSSYLSNRVVHLQITGTVQSPVIRIDPLRLLTEEAVRFFLTRALIPIS